MLGFYLMMLDSDEDNKRFTRIYSEYSQRMMSVAVGLLDDFHDAEEAVQNAFFAIAKNIDSLKTDNPELIEIYVYKAVKNACRNIAQKRGRLPNTVSTDDISEPACEYSLEDEVFSREAYRKLIEVIRSMPDTYRDALSLNLVMGMTAKQIAQLLSKPEATVRSQLSRGKRLLIRTIREASANEND